MNIGVGAFGRLARAARARLAKAINGVTGPARTVVSPAIPLTLSAVLVQYDRKKYAGALERPPAAVQSRFHRGDVHAVHPDGRSKRPQRVRMRDQGAEPQARQAVRLAEGARHEEVGVAVDQRQDGGAGEVRDIHITPDTYSEFVITD